MNRKPRVVLCGWYGASNVGDELLLGAIVDWVKELGGEPTIISLNPAHTEQVYRQPAVDFHNLGEIGQALAESDLFIMGGGGIFQDHHPFNACALYDPLMSDIAQYARPFYMARQFGLKTMILAHGVGPLRSAQAQAIARDVFSKADVVTIRDDQSTELLRRIGITRPIITAPDPGWYAASQVISGLALTKHEDSPKKTLGLIIREWPKDAGWSDKLVDAINTELPENWQCTWFAFQHALDEQRAASDRPYLEQLSDALADRIEDQIVDCIDVSAMTTALDRCDALVSMRLHGSILAIALGKPCGFLEYDDKMIRAHEMAGVPQDLRMALTAPAPRFNELISALTQPGKQTPAWTIVPSTHDSLRQAALAHRTELASLLESLGNTERGFNWEAKDGFDWLNTWMQHLIWQKRDVQRASDRAHALLRYRDSQLQQSADRAEILERDTQDLNLQLESARQEADQLRQIIDQQQARINDIDADNCAKSTYILEKEIHVAMLEQIIQKHSRTLESKVAGAYKVLTPKVKRAIYLLQNGGPAALLSAVKRRRQIKAALNEEPLVAISTNPESVADAYFQASSQLREEELVIFGNQSFSALGEQHRGAQLARAALAAGHRVVYISPAVDPEPRHLPGLLNFALPGLTNGELFQNLSEHSLIIYLNSSPDVIPFAKYAKDRGLNTVFDTFYCELLSSNPHDAAPQKLAELADRICISEQTSARYFDAVHANKTFTAPQAASQTYFDIYKEYQLPFEWQSDSRKKGLVLITEGTGHWVDWGYLKLLAEMNQHLTIQVLGLDVIPEMPGNVNLLPIQRLDQANLYVAHSDFIVTPVSDVAGASAFALSSALPGLFLRKPVVCNKELLVGNLFHLPTPVAMDLDQISSSAPANNDLLVAENSWLGRLEQLIPALPRQDVSVVILIHNNARIIGRCLQTLLLHCSPYVREVIVVDNASSDDGASIVESEFPSVKLIRNPENGCSSGRNLGVTHATGKYIAFFDSDQWFTGSSGFAEALAILEDNANVGVIGWNAGWFDATRTDLGGMIADYCPNRAMNAQAIRDGYRSDIGFLGTSGFFMRRATFDAIAGFDTYYDPTCFEDTDLCFQIRALDMEVSFRDLSGIRHQPHQTTGADSGSERYKKLFLRNSTYFKEKWRAHPEYFLDYTP